VDDTANAIWSRRDTANTVWWRRVQRAAAQHPDGRKLMSDWVQDMIVALSWSEGHRLQLTGPWGQRRWTPVRDEWLTDEWKAAETRRLSDKLGVTLGVGPKPGGL
jgi:hypothetical protein